MTDPYKVLGVSPTADDSEIKAAYRELAKKYHPDNYANNPLGDLANEKMTEINEAYDEIMNMRRGGSSERGESSAYNGSSSSYSQIRHLIRSGNITQAESLLDQVPAELRDAEWYFLKGSVAYSRGWLNEAYNCFSRAATLDPSNKEYAAALSQMQQRRDGYMNGGPSKHYNPDDGAGCICPMCCGPCGACEICNALICTDCCCECMGGDFIACC